MRSVTLKRHAEAWCLHVLHSIRRGSLKQSTRARRSHSRRWTTLELAGNHCPGAIPGRNDLAFVQDRRTTGGISSPSAIRDQLKVNPRRPESRPTWSRSPTSLRSVRSRRRPRTWRRPRTGRGGRVDGEGRLFVSIQRQRSGLFAVTQLRPVAKTLVPVPFCGMNSR